jgi:hypothetical protein
MPPASSHYLQGAVCGMAAASIWASWSVITRLVVTTRLDAWDIAALRFGVAGLLLSPVLVPRGLARDRLGWRGLAVLIAGLGAPYALVAAGGFPPAVRSGGGPPGRVRWRGLWRVGAGAAGPVRHPPPRGVAQRRGLVGLVLVSAGVYLASGGPWPSPEDREAPGLWAGRPADNAHGAGCETAWTKGFRAGIIARDNNPYLGGTP